MQKSALLSLILGSFLCIPHIEAINNVATHAIQVKPIKAISPRKKLRSTIKPITAKKFSKPVETIKEPSNSKGLWYAFKKKFNLNRFVAQDASEYYQKLFRKALKNFGIKNVEKIAIKKISKDDAAYDFAYAFVAVGGLFKSGIWINEEKLNARSDEFIEYVAHHEAAHYASLHTGKAVACAMSLYGLLIGLFQYSVPDFKTMDFLRDAAIIGTSAYLAAKATVLNKKFCLHFEQEADYEAVKVLAGLGKDNAIYAGINATPYDGDELHKKYCAFIASQKKITTKQAKRRLACERYA